MSDIDHIWSFSTDFVKFPKTKVSKSRPLVKRSGTCGQTDRHGDATSCILEFM